MRLNKKVLLEKASWDWCSNVDPSGVTDEHVRTAYRVSLPKCKYSCKRNCRGNPYCLSGIGESKWLNQAAEDSDDEEAEYELRQPSTFVGLKNLGATCYVNSLLQLWFHYLSFRRAIFMWNPDEDPLEVAGAVAETPFPRTVVGHLQLVFALMQFGRRKVIDPLDFIKALDLEPSMQQDAQEFSKLFISLLEESLSHQSNNIVKNFIKNHFCGEYSYITRCSRCQKESVSGSTFYELELNVKGHKTLHESLTEFLTEEKLEGANMYSCGECGDKQEATRKISLRELPRVLNLQLMRFVYDRQKGHKKKLNTTIQFPDKIDMSLYFDHQGSGNPPAPMIYDLTAVLIHKGPSAYSGHYIAHIRDQVTSDWYRFNDALVKKMEGKKLKIGGTEDDDGGSKKKQPRLGKGIVASSNAYMLVYTSGSGQGDEVPLEENDLPEYLQQEIMKTNDEFFSLIAQSKDQKKLEKMSGKAHRQEIAEILKQLPVTDSCTSVEAISSNWITHWLSNANAKVNPVDNNKLLCSHKKLSPDRTNQIKYITRIAAESLYVKYDGGPRLDVSDSLCKECVTAKCKKIRLRAKITDDAKEINSILRHPITEDQPSFWIGKQSLKNWQKKAVSMYLENDDGKNQQSEGDGDDGWDQPSCWTGKQSQKNWQEKMESMDLENDENKSRQFEADGEDLSSDGENNSVKAEGSIKKDGATKNLTTSEMEVDDAHSGGEKSSESVTTTTNGPVDSSTADDGPGGIKRKRSQANMSDGEEKGNKSEDEEISPVEDFNEDIVCMHGNLTINENSRRLISLAVWLKLKSYFPTVKEFSRETESCEQCKLMASVDEATRNEYRQEAISQKKNLFMLLTGRHRPKLMSATVHVVSVSEFLRPWRKFIRDAGKLKPLHSLRNSSMICQHNLLMYDPGSKEDADQIAALTDAEWAILSTLYFVDQEITVTYDEYGVAVETYPKLCQECLMSRLQNEQLALLQYDKAKVYIRQQFNVKIQDENSQPSSPESKRPKSKGNGETAEAVTRRSTRLRKVKGEKTVTISCHDTLMDLKLQILNIFGVAPFDQHLCTEDGKELTDDSATLPLLNIYPDSILLLKVDEAADDATPPLEDYRRTTEVEEGFKGTVLLKR